LKISFGKKNKEKNIKKRKKKISKKALKFVLWRM